MQKFFVTYPLVVWNLYLIQRVVDICPRTSLLDPRGGFHVEVVPGPPGSTGNSELQVKRGGGEGLVEKPCTPHIITVPGED